ncbi:hypothetical protein BANRA_01727 [Klebsiella pneumoniae]|nr:hypothetical protein BANRA_01727 [Klebsiella pneumoniae]
MEDLKSKVGFTSFFLQLITYGLLCSALFLSGYSSPAVTRNMEYWIAVCFYSFSQPDCFLFVCCSSGSLFKGFLILNPKER